MRNKNMKRINFKNSSLYYLIFLLFMSTMNGSYASNLHNAQCVKSQQIQLKKLNDNLHESSFDAIKTNTDEIYDQGKDAVPLLRSTIADTTRRFNLWTALFGWLIGREAEYEILKLKHKNPTVYIFPAGVDSIKRILKGLKKEISTEINQETLVSSELIFIGSDSLSQYNQRICDLISLKTYDNRNDAVYYHYYGRNPLFTSKESIISYGASFQIHLDSLDTDTTQVRIITHNPKITVEVITLFDHAPGFYNYHSVEPTTIEEYKILRLLGKKLNISGKMPALILPDN